LRDNETQTSGASRRENADVYPLFDIRIEALDPSLRGANGSRECAPDDRLRDEAIHSHKAKLDCFASLAMTNFGNPPMKKGRIIDPAFC